MVGINHESLVKPIKEVDNERTRLLAFMLIDFFYSVWFLNLKKKSRYRKQWDQNINHVFKYSLIQSVFEKHSDQFDPEYQEFVKNVILKKKN